MGVAECRETGRGPDATAVAAGGTRWTLSQRQVAVLEHVARGLANATIAALLGVSERAIEHHVTALLQRAGVTNRAGLVAAVLA